MISLTLLPATPEGFRARIFVEKPATPEGFRAKIVVEKTSNSERVQGYSPKNRFINKIGIQ
jgi:hypothetical protein